MVGQFTNEDAGGAVGGRRQDPSSLNLRLLASLNHEIRTPLSGLLGMLDLLVETKLDAEQMEYVEAARECAGTLFGLLSLTLEFTALESGCAHLEESEFHLGETLSAAVVEPARKAIAKGEGLVWRPDASIDRVVSGDGYRVRQLVTLLIEHSLQFTPAGTVDLEAALIERGPAEVVLRLALSDRGLSVDVAGMIPEYEGPPLVDDGPSGRWSGGGMSLAVLRRLSGLLRGRMHVEPLPEQGCRICVELPLQAPAAQTEPEALAGLGGVTAAPRVLLVEDNRITQQVLAAVLSKGGVAFDCAWSGVEALEAVARQRYALVLMDICMPGLDGFETFVRLRDLPGERRPPVIALTADVSDDVRARCRELGFAGYLQKPVQPRELLDAVHRQLDYQRTA